MTFKKILAGVLSFAICLSSVGFASGNMPVYAKEQAAGGFHYEQLDDTAKSVYDGIYAMYESGLLKTGTQDYDLAANGQFSAEQIQEYAKNSSKLTSAMNAARYAFYADYPEVFYVNFPKLSLRTTKDKDGAFHIYIGSGRYENYYIDGFSNESDVDDAIQAFDARVEELVDGANALDIKEGQDRQKEQVKYVHNEIIKHTSYRLEDTCFEGDGDQPSNASYLGTPYGVLVKKQGVCEGYSRAFKTVMDRLGINCILVQGVHQYDSEVAVSHMWNYVELTDGGVSGARQVGGRWYAVDLTQDDPELVIVEQREFADYTQHFDTYGDDGFENEKYLLAGQSTMNGRHFINETVDAAGGYTFAYPTLEDDDYGTSDVLNNMDGFSVKQKTVHDTTGQDLTEFQISYLGMNMTKAREQGIYLLAKYYDYGEGEDSENIVPLTGWCYFSDSYSWKEDDTSVYIQEGNVMYMEFAATNVKPREGLEGLTYAGDDFGLIARTGLIYNEHQNDYIAPPFVLKQTPTQTSTIAIRNRPYHVTAVYDESLVLEDGLTLDDIGYKITCRALLGSAVTGDKYTKIENIKWDGDKTIEFDVTFSQMYADDNVNYSIYITGLIGKNSRKVPNPVTYSAAVDVECPSVQQRRGSWDIFGKPTLLENEDLSVNDWKLSNGKDVSEKLKNRLTLVTTKTTDVQEEQMQEALNSEFPEISDKIVSSSTYNITLSVCKLAVVKTGHKVKVRLGFPEGYGPENEGVTYKAYHFKRDDQGNVTGVEEIDCVVTPYGLIITCDAFSPFTIAAVENENPEVNPEKSVVVTAADGGTVAGTDLNETGILKLSDGDTKMVRVKAADGYEIETITVCGKTIEVTDPSAVDVELRYDSVDTANNIVHATFVAKAVLQKEAKRQENPVDPVVEPATVVLPNSLNVSSELMITPVISETDGVQTYQWYKDGEKLDGKTNNILTIQNLKETDAGDYQLQVVTTSGTVSADTMSNVCKVSVSGETDCMHENVVLHPAVLSTCKDHGHGEYTICSDCGSVVSGSDEELPLASHDYAENVSDEYLKSKATCTEKAVYFKSCSVCGLKSDETFEYGEPEGHVLKKVDEKAATHDADGNRAYYACETCGKFFDDDKASLELSTDDVIIKKQGHAYGDDYKFDQEYHWKECDCGSVDGKEKHTVVNKMDPMYLKSEASHGVKAVYFKSCFVCGAKLDETFTYDDSESHDKTVVRGDKPATCTDDGYTGDIYCEACGIKLSDGEVIPAKGHTLEKVDGKPATHTEDGIIEHYQCSECGRLFGDKDGKSEIEAKDIVAPKTGHKYGDTYVSDSENHWKACSCGDISDKAPHVFGDWTVVEEPTDVKMGVRERVCSVCGYKVTEELPVISDPDGDEDGSDGAQDVPDKDKNKDKDKDDDDVNGDNSGDVVGLRPEGVSSSGGGNGNPIKGSSSDAVSGSTSHSSGNGGRAVANRNDGASDDTSDLRVGKGPQTGDAGTTSVWMMVFLCIGVVSCSAAVSVRKRRK